MTLEEIMREGVNGPPVDVTVAPTNVVSAVTQALVVVALAVTHPVMVDVSEFFPDPVLGTLEEIEAGADHLHAVVHQVLPGHF